MQATALSTLKYEHLVFLNLAGTPLYEGGHNGHTVRLRMGDFPDEPLWFVSLDEAAEIPAEDLPPSWEVRYIRSKKADLAKHHPILSWKHTVEKYRKLGLEGDAIHEAIIRESVASPLQVARPWQDW